jgi:F-type H+-transporting ATPase subunit delta
MSTVTHKVARRYAKALALLTDERGEGEVVRASLQRLRELFDAEPKALELLADPTVSLEARRGIVERALDGLQVDKTARAFVLVLLQNGRMAVFPPVERAFAALLDARSGRVRAQVTSAVALSDAAAVRLKGVVERMLGKQVELELAHDADLLGGLVVKVGNTVYDASVRNHLNKLRYQLVHE